VQLSEECVENGESLFPAPPDIPEFPQLSDIHHKDSLVSPIPVEKMRLFGEDGSLFPASEVKIANAEVSALRNIKCVPKSRKKLLVYIVEDARHYPCIPSCY